MKRYSISLFALLAVVFAVASAFTTSSSSAKRASKSFEVWTNNLQTTNITTQAPMVVPGQTKVLNARASAYSLPEITAAVNPTLHCAGSAEICVAQVSYTDGTLDATSAPVTIIQGLYF